MRRKHQWLTTLPISGGVKEVKKGKGIEEEQEGEGKGKSINGNRRTEVRGSVLPSVKGSTLGRKFGWGGWS